ncbi:MAG: LPS-assembly protein LptD, partial [Paludibacteraceae bacterium]|nr:LPS-assembly protein LptD [Paludibacteraceae bacterium]
MRLYKPKYLLLLAIPLLLTSIATSAYAKKTSTTAEKTEDASNTTRQDSTSTPKKKSSLTAPVKYTAKDSIVLYKAGNAYMYGEGSVQYENMELTADYIHLNADSTKIDAHGVLDADSALVGTPVFKENGEEYEARTIEYNYDTKKGFVRQAVVKQGDGYVVGKEAKKIGDDIFYMKNGHYTTCDNHEHPHFYLNLTKAKVKQKHWVATGPAYMVLMDVPLPLAVPFGFFPFTKSYSSGVIMPSYGDEMNRGFYLKEGGYYFAINDYFDLALTGDIYTKGSWAVNATSRYVKRYK